MVYFFWWAYRNVSWVVHCGCASISVKIAIGLSHTYVNVLCGARIFVVCSALAVRYGLYGFILVVRCFMYPYRTKYSSWHISRTVETVSRTLLLIARHECDRPNSRNHYYLAEFAAFYLCLASVRFYTQSYVYRYVFACYRGLAYMGARS